MRFLLDLNQQINSLVWGPPMMIFLMGTGVLLTIFTRGIQARKLAFALREVLGKLFSKAAGEGEVTPFQAVATALASTVGVGNIAGVSTAIVLGGPGALFWLWVSGLLGMCTKFAEIAVALYYRQRDPSGQMRGGAMYVLTEGLRLRWLGQVFAFLTAAAAFGIGNMVQANSVAEAAKASLAVPAPVSGAILVVLAGLVVLGGIRRIAEVTQYLVPFMCLLYLTGAVVVLVRFAGEIPAVIALVLESAFEGHAAAGGFAGATVMMAIRYGIARGLFSNEAGLGSAPIVHASAVTDHPIRQACYGIFEVFIDTMVVCLITGFVILSTGVWQSGDTGAALAAKAFAVGLPGEWGHYIVTSGMILFAFSSIIGWCYYGETGATFLFGPRAALPYRLAWLVFVWLGETGTLHVVWDIADTLNGLMAIPNLVAVLGSLPLLGRLIRDFFEEGASNGWPETKKITKV
ncbi:MAG: sodium:alanine symporter family protein [Bryobacterales bacterium]|nr:sodium:alanine symporter family protein [Bryobacterales bacterium]